MGVRSSLGEGPSVMFRQEFVERGEGHRQLEQLELDFSVPWR